MIFHTIRTIRIGDFSEMLTAKDRHMVKRVPIWLPEWLIDKYYSKLITSHNKNTNEKQVKELLEEDKHRLLMLVKVNLQYSALIDLIEMAEEVKSLGYSKKFVIIKEKLKEVYRLIYNRDPKTEKDYKKVRRDKELAIKRYKQQYPDKEIKEVKEIDFEEIIIKTELALAPLSIREKKLYTLNRYLAMAALKMKPNG